MPFTKARKQRKKYTGPRATKVDTVRQATDVACRLLIIRDYTTHEIREKLKKRKFSEEVIEKTIEELTSYKFLNDPVFVGKYVRTRLEFKPRGRYLLSMELRKRGIAKEHIEAYFEENPVDEELHVKRLIEKKLQRLKRTPKEKQRTRIAYYLSSRGFSLEHLEAMVLLLAKTK